MNIFYHKHDDAHGSDEHEPKSCCSRCANPEVTFTKEKKAPSKESIFIRQKEVFIILARIILTGITFFCVGLFLEIAGKSASGFIHTHSYSGFGGESIFLWGMDVPIVFFYFIPYLIIGYDILWRSIKNISKGEVFDENFLMGIATIGALLLGEYGEAISVMLFYQAGEMFQDMAVRRSKKSITDLMDIRPDFANVEKDGILTQVDPLSVNIGDIIVVKPGEKIPLDGVLLEGNGSLDTSALTGESFPRVVGVGDEILSGCLNVSTVLKIKVSKAFGESTVSKILQMVQHASSKKAHVERFVTRFAKYYTPVVVIGAALLAFVPPLFTGGDWLNWIQRALILLVISCPCALVISVPLGFFAGIGCSSRHGILIKGGNYLEALSKLEIAVFDKTGTLTRGIFTVTAVHIVPHEDGVRDEKKESELLEITALAERYSNHPISLAIKNEYFVRTEKNILESSFESRVKDVEEIAGKGVKAIVDGKNIYVGNTRLMEEIGCTWDECHEFGTIIHVAIDKVYAGHIVISDEPKTESAGAIKELKNIGIKKVLMLTGDSKQTGEHIGNELGLDEVFTELMPGDKVLHVEKLLDDLKTVSDKKRGMLGFVGDGINDAPVLALADVGIAMGALGSDAAIEAADIVLMDDNPAKLPLAMRIARSTLNIVKQNIWFALGIKALVMILAGLGYANMWMAIFADTGVALLAVLNSMRAFRIKQYIRVRAEAEIPQVPHGTEELEP